MSASNYLENKVLDHIFGKATYTAPSNIYVSLHTADPGETGTNETSGTNYARKSSAPADWNSSSGGQLTNANALTFATPGSGGWGTVTHFGLWDASGAGNFLFGGALAVSKTVAQDDVMTFPAGSLTVTAD